MAKVRTIYVCNQCGGTSPKWQGQCPDCGSWNALEEAREESASRQQAGRAPRRADRGLTLMLQGRRYRPAGAELSATGCVTA